MNFKSLTQALILGGSALVSFAASAATTNLVQNDWFVSGPYNAPTNWSVSLNANANGGVLYDASANPAPGAPASGSYFLYAGHVWGYGEGSMTLSQSISGLTLGQTYTLSFYESGWYNAAFTPTVSNQWSASLGNSAVQTAAAYAPSSDDPGTMTWTQVTMDFVAGAATQVLTLNGAFLPSAVPQYIAITGVSLTQAAPVPEPATGALLALGLATIGLMARRRRAQ